MTLNLVDVCLYQMLWSLNGGHSHAYPMHKEFTIVDSVYYQVTDGILEVEGPKLRATTEGSAQKANNSQHVAMRYIPKKTQVSCDGRLTNFEGRIPLKWWVAPTLMILLCK